MAEAGTASIGRDVDIALGKRSADAMKFQSGHRFIGVTEQPIVRPGLCRASVESRSEGAQ